jgi:uncharacterized protein (DUF433 family)
MARLRPPPAAEIVRNPRVLGGEPTVKGTRVPVRSIVLAARYEQDLDYVADAYLLPREAVDAALRFYEQNRAEIDQYISDNDDPDA